MPIVQSFGALQAMTDREPSWSSSSSGSLTLYDHHQAYAEIYRTQPNVRICVEFLARNIAQLGLHVFRRVSETDRVRLNDHELARWFAKPNPSTRRYRLIESLVGDLGIYFEAYWLKIRYLDIEGRKAIGLVRLPPDEMRVEGGVMPSRFIWTVNGREKEFPPSEIVFFNGYNPCHPFRGLSPLESLRRILADEAAAGDYRESYWRNAGRMEGIVEQSKEGPTYTAPQLKAFKEQLEEFKARGSKPGEMAVLPLGMSAKQWSFSAKDSEYVQGGKLRREVCAAEYHIPQPMVGILDHATFSNIREQHKHTYQDTLAPWLEMIQQEVEGQLLIECEDQRDVYVEFNIAAKLAGSFEEQATSLQQLVGRPIMTANEGRARINLPSIKDDPSADRLAAQQGGPASNSADAPPGGGSSNPDDAPPDEELGGENRVIVTEILQRTRQRQLARLNKASADDRAATFFANLDRWNRELATDLRPLLGDVAAFQQAVQANVRTLLALESPEAS